MIEGQRAIAECDLWPVSGQVGLLFFRNAPESLSSHLFKPRNARSKGTRRLRRVRAALKPQPVNALV